jgi:hypothetical protein
MSLNLNINVDFDGLLESARQLVKANRQKITRRDNSTAVRNAASTTIATKNKTLGQTYPVAPPPGFPPTQAPTQSRPSVNTGTPSTINTSLRTQTTSSGSMANQNIGAPKKDFYRGSKIGAGPRRDGELGFLLPSGLTFDTSIQGPFAPVSGSSNGLSHTELMRDGAFFARVKGYTNNFVTSQAVAWGDGYQPDGANTIVDARPLYSSDGGYQGGYLTYPRNPLSNLPDGEVSFLYLHHLIAAGSAIRTKWTESQGGGFQLTYASGEPLRSVPGSSNSKGFTLEFIVKLAASETGVGYSRVIASVFASDEYGYNSANAFSISFYVEAIDQLNDNGVGTTFNGYIMGTKSDKNWYRNGSFIHFAFVVKYEGPVYTTAYVNGERVTNISDSITFPPDEIQYGRSRFFNIELFMDDANRVLSSGSGGSITTGYPGKSTLKALRWTNKILYTGNSFNPPTDLTSLA